MTPAIETHRLRKEFNDKTAVANLTLTVERGEVFGFLGPNGAGKSTLLKALAGLLPHEGRIEIDGDLLDFEAGEETLSRTNLGHLIEGDKVNLERSLAVGDRLGGHYVTGHVDALGTLVERRDDPPWAHLRFQLPSEFASQVASKGSIAICEGISSLATMMPGCDS